MAFNTKAVVRDVNNKPIPQYFNSGADNYEVIKSNDGLLRVMLVDAQGNEVVTQDIADQVENKLDELIQAVNAIGV